MTAFQRPPDGRSTARQRVLNAIRTIAELKPDLRIGQIVVAATPARFNNDAFNVTDEELAEGLTNLYGHLTT